MLKGQYLFNAARAGDRSTLQTVLAAEGAAVDLESKHGWDRQTALRAAAEHGHADCLSDLIKAGANFDARDIFGYTPLHRAVGPTWVDSSAQRLLAMAMGYSMWHACLCCWRQVQSLEQRELCWDHQRALGALQK